jgi:hypothetical protein
MHSNKDPATSYSDIKIAYSDCSLPACQLRTIKIFPDRKLGWDRHKGIMTLNLRGGCAYSFEDDESDFIVLSEDTHELATSGRTHEIFFDT